MTTGRRLAVVSDPAVAELLTSSALRTYIASLAPGIQLRCATRPTARLGAEQLPTLISRREELEGLNARRFEQLVADLLLADGFSTVNLVPRLNAAGPDIIALIKGPFGADQEYVVECKRWHGPVGVDVVRGLSYRVETEYRATGGLIVSTSTLTSAAVDEIERFSQWRMNYKDGDAVVEWINKHTRTISERWVTRQPMTGQDQRLFLELLGSLNLAASDACCQVCAGSVICAYVDVGALDFYDNYFHLCIDCLRVQHELRFEELQTAELPGCLWCTNIW